MNDQLPTTELLAIRGMVYNWYSDYAECGFIQDYLELLDLLLYPYLWRLFYERKITKHELVELGSYAEGLGAALEMEVSVMFEPGKVNIPLENPVMGITGYIKLDPKVIPEYLDLCDEARDQMVNGILAAISGALGWQIFSKRFEAEKDKGKERH